MDLFKTHESLEEYFETVDGQKFYSEGSAKNYAKDLKDQKIKVVKRNDIVADELEDFSTSAKLLKQNAKEVIAAIPKMELEDAQKYYIHESNNRKRVTVIQALFAKMQEFDAVSSEIAENYDVQTLSEDNTNNETLRDEAKD